MNPLPWLGLWAVLTDAQDEVCHPVTSRQLLQTSRAQSRSQRSPEFHYEPESMWGLDWNASWALVRNSSGCFLRFPSSSSGPARKESALSLGRCLERAARRGARWRVDLGLPATGNRRHPGTNPALVPLPSHLQSAFPEGRWLVVNRVGWARCPGMNDFKGSIFAFLGNLWGSGSYAAVLDADFEVLDVAKIGLRQGRWENAISDVRLWADPAGDLIISFMPYYFAERFHNFVAKLHLDSEAGRLEAWVDRREVRRAQSCGESDGPKKNLGFFALNGSTFALDKISPTSVDAFDLSELELEKEPQALARHNHSYPQVTLPALCMAPAGPGGTMPREDPWKDCRGQEKELFLHNGPPPLWLEEPGFYLGIGHLVRGKREMRPFHYTLPDHYTHQFFALSATRPFRLLALSPEFCFSSEQDAEDCENIQFASSLLREGNDSLLVGYGVQDCDAFLQRLSLHEVLASLVALE